MPPTSPSPMSPTPAPGGVRAAAVRRKLQTPRAAAVAGILFALLYGASLVLIRLSTGISRGWMPPAG